MVHSFIRSQRRFLLIFSTIWVKPNPNSNPCSDLNGMTPQPSAHCSRRAWLLQGKMLFIIRWRLVIDNCDHARPPRFSTCEMNISWLRETRTYLGLEPESNSSALDSPSSGLGVERIPGLCAQWLGYVVLNIAMPASRKVYGYAAQLTNKVANYRIQMSIQKTVFVQACRFLNRQNWR